MKHFLNSFYVAPIIKDHKVASHFAHPSVEIFLPTPSSLTLSQNKPHTNRSLHTNITVGNQTLMDSPVPPSSEIGFPKYPDLPQDLRLQIIEHAIKASNRRDEPWSLTQLACIHSDWNRIIERILFKSIQLNNQELTQFASICGKRHGLLRRIRFGVLTGSQNPERAFLHSLLQLFRIMKGWNGADTKPDDLIKLSISVMIPEPWSSDGPIMPSHSSFSYGLGILPEVSVIGGMRLFRGSTPAFALDPSYMNSLYAKLPNLHSAELNLPPRYLAEAMIDAANSKHNYTTRNLHITETLTIFSRQGSRFACHKAEPEEAELRTWLSWSCGWA